MSDIDFGGLKLDGAGGGGGGAAAAPPDTSLQFNSGGSLAGDADATFDGSSVTLANVLFSDGGIDRSGAGDLLIGDTNATSVTIGMSLANVTIAGNAIASEGVTVSAGFGVTIESSAGLPTGALSEGILSTFDVSGTTELFYTDSAGSNIQITSGGAVVGGTSVVIPDNTAVAYEISNAVGGALWVTMDTSNGAERFQFGNPAALAGSPTQFIINGQSNSTTFLVRNSALGNRDSFRVDQAFFNIITVGNSIDATELRVAGDGLLVLGSATGDVQAMAMRERASNPVHVTNFGRLWVRDVAGLGELHYGDTNGIATQQVSQITTDGQIGGPTQQSSFDVSNFPERGADPGGVANTGRLYTKDVAGVTELFFQRSDGTVVQLS